MSTMTIRRKPSLPGSDGLDSARLLEALVGLEKGDFSVRLPSDWNGVPGKVADAFNEVKQNGSNTNPNVTQRNTAFFWTANVIRQYNGLARDLTSAKSMDLVQSARLFAMVDRARPSVLEWKAGESVTTFRGRHHGYEALPAPATVTRTLRLDGSARTPLDDVPDFMAQHPRNQRVPDSARPEAQEWTPPHLPIRRWYLELSQETPHAGAMLRFSRLHVVVVLVAQAAHETAARARYLGRVEGELLVLRHPQVHGTELRKP